MGSAFSSITSKKQISQVFSGDYSRTNRKEITTMKGTCLHRMLTIYCRVVNTKSPVCESAKYFPNLLGMYYPPGNITKNQLESGEY